ncbi:MAG: hypothetical protein RL113_1124 [Pseudomonadota bacterium]|jgi:DNA-binding response OmpR family regulator
MSTILLLEDDANLNDTITEFLQDKGYVVDSVYDGDEAEEKLYENRYDLLLLDVNTPGINGFELLENARKAEMVSPAIFITSLNGVEDLEKGFKSGCDDYIRKPFDLKELQIRIDTLLARTFYHQHKNVIEIDNHIGYEMKNGELIMDGQRVSLGLKEAMLLKLFMQHQEEVITHERIYAQLWDFEEEPSDTALRTYIKNLRKLIGKERIVSIKKQGYKFTTGK